MQKYDSICVHDKSIITALNRLNLKINEMVQAGWEVNECLQIFEHNKEVFLLQRIVKPDKQTQFRKQIEDK